MSYDLKQDLVEIEDQIEESRNKKQRGRLLSLRKIKRQKQREIARMTELSEKYG